MSLRLPRRRRRTPPGAFEGNDVTLLPDGPASFDAMEQAIEEARFEVLLEMYWFSSDDTGQRFANALQRAAARGCSIRVIYDSVGSWETDSSMFEQMRLSGCQVLEYNPIAPWRQRFHLGVVTRRNHRKALVVDGATTFLGGANLADAWASEAEGGLGWRDEMVRLNGPAAWGVRALFEESWAALGGTNALPSGVEPAPPHPGGSRVRILADHHRSQVIRREYLRQISQAETTVFVANSYFVPDRLVRRALARAAQRGVDVRVLVPSESDVPAVLYASQRLYARLMRHGVRLFEWFESMLHSKTAVIDSRWCTVGSYNLDWRSWRFNLEITAVIEDPRIAGKLQARFAESFERAYPLDSREWRLRPLSRRLLESFWYLFHPLL